MESRRDRPRPRAEVAGERLQPLRDFIFDSLAQFGLGKRERSLLTEYMVQEGDIMAALQRAAGSDEAARVIEHDRVQPSLARSAAFLFVTT